MKTYLLDIIPKIERFSQRLDNLTLLNDQHWVSIDHISQTKTVFIFRKNQELIISTNGKVEKAKWEFLGNNSILIDINNESYLYKHGFFDENILVLKADGSNEYAVFANENKYFGELNSIENIERFLSSKYLNNIPQIENSLLKSDNKDEKLKNVSYGYIIKSGTISLIVFIILIIIIIIIETYIL